MKRWETFFCPTLQLKKLAIKTLLKSQNESMVLGDNFLNHDIVGPLKVTKKAMNITSFEGSCMNPNSPLDPFFFRKPLVRKEV